MYKYQILASLVDHLIFSSTSTTISAMLASLSRIAQSLFVVSLLLTSVVDAHPGEPEPVYTARQLERRQAGIQKRHNLARNCNSAVLAYEARRKAKREAPAENPKGRGHGHKPTQSSKPFPVSNQSLLASSTSAASATSSASDPTYSSIQNVGLLLLLPVTFGS